jgi:hypothetical protein
MAQLIRGRRPPVAADRLALFRLTINKEVAWMLRRNRTLSILALAAASVIGAQGCGDSLSESSSLPVQRCAIDMGSNTFRLIVASFQDGRYEQRRLDRRTLGVGEA